MEKTLRFNELPEFNLIIKHATIDGHAKANVHYPHVHNFCEIYINISGDVSFVVENKLYPISTGSVLITKPNEFHHCVYNNMNMLHEHYCLWVPMPESSGIMERFFCRKNGEDNLVIFNPIEFDKVKRLCNKLIEGGSNLDRWLNFIELIHKISAEANTDNTDYTQMPRDVAKGIEFIYKNYSNSITVVDIAACCNVSVNTLERHFKEYVKMTPYGFLKFKRMAVAVERLQKGSSVQEAAYSAGFADCSKFITEFKKIYKKTPHKFKQQQ